MNIEPLKVVILPIDKIQPWEKNPRKDHAVKQIQASMEAFGYLNPILVQASSNRIVAGHGRYQALKETGVERVPVISLDIPDEKADMYTLADNKIAELSNWDFTQMADLLLEFDAQNFDVNLLGFTDDEIEAIMNVTPSGEVEGSQELDFRIIIECENETDQREVFEKLTGLGLKAQIKNIKSKPKK
tara:strand:+ start:396 stop:956 length:561 start_codon:yes stop_codon:yes gene_type:complete